MLCGNPTTTITIISSCIAMTKYKYSRQHQLLTVGANENYSMQKAKLTCTSATKWRSTAEKESTISTSGIEDRNDATSALLRACLQIRCCSCSTTARRRWNHGIKLGPSKNRLYTCGFSGLATKVHTLTGDKIQHLE